MIKDPQAQEEILAQRKFKAENPKLPGPPKTTLEDLREDWREVILSHMKEGASIVEVRAELGISSTLWERLVDEEPEFATIVQQGKELCEAWWMTQARSNLYNGKFQTVLWYMNMKNRFGWKDKAEVDYTSGGKPLLPQIMVFGVNDPLNKKINQLKEKNDPVPQRINETDVPLQLDASPSST